MLIIPGQFALKKADFWQKGAFILFFLNMPPNPIFSQISIFATLHSSSLLGWEFAVTSDLDCLDQQLFSVNYLFGQSNIA